MVDDSESLSSGGGDLALVLGHHADLAEERSEKVAKKVLVLKEFVKFSTRIDPSEC